VKETPAEAAAILAEGSAALDADFSKLSAEAAEARGTIGGGAWSARDLAGHLETWAEVALRTIDEVRDGRPPSIHNTVTDEASLDLFNAAEVERKATRGWTETLAGLRATNARLVAAVQAIADEDWEQAVPGGPGGGVTRTLGEHVGSSTGRPQHPFRHAWAHLADLEAFVQATTVGPPGPNLDTAPGPH
jgi:Mycothiol maleylpyruvate isomerase N-terminal domain